MTSRDPKGAVRQYGRQSSRELGFLLKVFQITKEITWPMPRFWL